METKYKIQELKSVEDLKGLINKDIVNLNSSDYSGKLMYIEEPRGNFNGFYRSLGGKIIQYDINETNINVEKGALVEKKGMRIKQLTYQWYNAESLLDMFLPILREANL